MAVMPLGETVEELRRQVRRDVQHAVHGIEAANDNIFFPTPVETAQFVVAETYGIPVEDVVTFWEDGEGSE